MKSFLIILELAITISAGSLSASPGTEAAQRAKEFAELFSTLRAEPQWMSVVIPEYWHPLGNDSGLPSPYPKFLPQIDLDRGVFLFTKLEIGRVISGNFSWFFDGVEPVWCVEILFTTVAKVERRVTLLEHPQVRSQFFVMAVDKKDGKWKNLDSYPDRAWFYQIPYFLKAWERILGKGSVQNIPEVSQTLLAMVKK